MPKDATRNIDSNQLRSSQLNSFEFQHNQGAFTEQQKEHDNWMGAPENDTALPPDKAKAARIRHLLEAHGESVPQTEERQSEELANASQTQASSEPSATRKDDRQNQAEASEDDFAPTHGRSPEVIKEMIQSRRATDKVPDPEDIVAGRAAKSKEKKEHGETGQPAGTRKANKQTASAKSKSPQATKGKEAALDNSKPGVAKGTREKKTDQQSVARKNSEQATAAKSGKQAASSTSTKQAATSGKEKQAAPDKRAKQTGSARAEKQTAGRKSAPQASSNSGNGAKSASSRSKTNGKAATPTAKPARTAASTRSKSPAGKSR